MIVFHQETIEESSWLNFEIGGSLHRRKHGKIEQSYKRRCGELSFKM